MRQRTKTEIWASRARTLTAPADRLLISFSGGRTSAMMTALLCQRFRPGLPVLVVFANTGCEHPRTLDFVKACDEYFGFDTKWVEAKTAPERGAGTKHALVSYGTASRAGEPFEQSIRKYGLPNKAFPGCTRELKKRPIDSLAKSLGFDPKTTPQAIGIRADEMDRQSTTPGCWYPLIELGVAKQDVIAWWKEQPFDLGIPEHWGNCVWCWKKSLRKLVTVARETPEAFDFPARMERDHAHTGAGVGPRVLFRERRCTQDILRLAGDPKILSFNDPNHNPQTPDDFLDIGQGCGESCEVGADEETKPWRGRS